MNLSVRKLASPGLDNDAIERGDSFTVALGDDVNRSTPVAWEQRHVPRTGAKP